MYLLLIICGGFGIRGLLTTKSRELAGYNGSVCRERTHWWDRSAATYKLWVQVVNLRLRSNSSEDVHCSEGRARREGRIIVGPALLLY